MPLVRDSVYDGEGNERAVLKCICLIWTALVSELSWPAAKYDSTAAWLIYLARIVAVTYFLNTAWIMVSLYAVELRSLSSMSFFHSCKTSVL